MQFYLYLKTFNTFRLSRGSSPKTKILFKVASHNLVLEVFRCLHTFHFQFPHILISVLFCDYISVLTINTESRDGFQLISNPTFSFSLTFKNLSMMTLNPPWNFYYCLCCLFSALPSSCPVCQECSMSALGQFSGSFLKNVGQMCFFSFF